MGRQTAWHQRPVTHTLPVCYCFQDGPLGHAPDDQCMHADTTHMHYKHNTTHGMHRRQQLGARLGVVYVQGEVTLGHAVIPASANHRTRCRRMHQHLVHNSWLVSHSTQVCPPSDMCAIWNLLLHCPGVVAIHSCRHRVGGRCKKSEFI